MRAQIFFTATFIGVLSSSILQIQALGDFEKCTACVSRWTQCSGSVSRCFKEKQRWIIMQNLEHCKDVAEGQDEKTALEQCQINYKKCRKNNKC